MENVTLTLTLEEAKKIKRVLFQAYYNTSGVVEKAKVKHLSNKVGNQIEAVEFSWLK